MIFNVLKLTQTQTSSFSVTGFLKTIFVSNISIITFCLVSTLPESKALDNSFNTSF